MTSEEQPSPAVQDPAGQQLRRAREALGLSLEQVAEAQHLRPSVIQDIEQGRYERIDSELFLKGYVRAYAKQVNLNAESLLSTLDQELEPLREQKAREAEANPLVSIERKKRQKRRIAKVLAWVGKVPYVPWPAPQASVYQYPVFALYLVPDLLRQVRKGYWLLLTCLICLCQPLLSHGIVFFFCPGKPLRHPFLDRCSCLSQSVSGSRNKLRQSGSGVSRYKKVQGLETVKIGYQTCKPLIP